MKTVSINGQQVQISETPCELTNIGIKYQSDKAWWHKYTHVYSKLFEYLGYARDSKITLLELGFSHGSSHLMWREYFPNATIIAIDIKPWKWYQDREKSQGTIEDRLQDIINTNFDKLFNKNFQLFVGDQKDLELLKKICDTFGKFDVILDDASHRNLETKASFDYLFPYLKDGSPYIIEDLHSTFLKDVRHDIEAFDALNNFKYLNHGDGVKSVSFIKMAYDLGLSKSLLPPHGNGASDMGIIIKK